MGGVFVDYRVLEMAAKISLFDRLMEVVKEVEVKGRRSLEGAEI